MAIDLVPRHPDPASSDYPPGMTHQTSEPCPFKWEGKSTEVSGSCCSFGCNRNAMYIMANELPPFFMHLHEDMSPEGAIKFAEGLRVAIQRLRDDSAEASKESDTAGNADPEDGMAKDIDADAWDFPIETELKEIEALADWCEKIGRMRFGTHLHRWF